MSSRKQAVAQWPVITDSRAASKGLRGTREVLEYERLDAQGKLAMSSDSNRV
jgi:hypothetical protein